MPDADTLLAVLPAIDFFHMEEDGTMTERDVITPETVDAKFTMDGEYPSYYVQDLVTEGVYGLIGEDIVDNPGYYRYQVLLDTGDWATGTEVFLSLDEAFNGLIDAWDREYNNG